MTINEMLDELENKVRDTYIVTLKYKYDFEKNYTIENHILEYDCMSDSYVWLDDWCEGQTDVEVLGYMPLNDVDTTNPLTCEDCISRTAAVRHRHLIYDDDGIGYSVVRVDEIKSLPPVTPQPKVGEWIDKGYDIGNCWATCSECDGYARGYAKDTGWGHDYYFPKFCPHCGARMNGGGEE